MPELSPAQLATLRRAVGTRKPTTPELQDIYDRTRSITDTAREVLEQRLADYLARPASMNIPGEYGEDSQANIKALQQQLAILGDLDDTDPVDVDDGRGEVVIVSAWPLRPR